jgi:hypothetical protein
LFARGNLVPRCDCSQNKLPTNATVKVNLINVSIAGRRGFVKEGLPVIATSIAFELKKNTTEVVTTKLFSLALTFLPFHHNVELQLFLADHLLDSAAVFLFIGGGKPFLERGNFTQQINLC